MSESELVSNHIPCPMCGGHDSAALYSDGHIYCFSCQRVFYDGDMETIQERKYTMKHNKQLIALEDIAIKNITARGLTADTCAKFSYGVYDGKQVANYYNDAGDVIFQKVRTKDKEFYVNGKKEYRFYGQHLFNHGKKLIITEGEIDCLTVSQLNGNKYPVVSVPFGAGSAEKTFKAQLDWLEGFESVIAMFDMDEQGQKAVKAIEGLLSPHKLKVASLPLKDANECLLTHRSADVINAIFDAKEYKPDGIYNCKDLFKQFLQTENVKSYPTAWSKLNYICGGGLRKGELTLLTAGTGCGKSTIARELVYHFKMLEKLKIGMLMLEESPKVTMQRLMSIHLEQPLQLKTAAYNDKDKLKEDFDAVFGDGNFILYDHFGSIESDNLLQKIRYMAVVEKCDFILLDHISIAISGLDAKEGERKVIDILMTQLRALVEETGVGILVISHLRKTSSGLKSAEAGGKIELDDLRGSGSLKQLPDLIIALERNVQKSSTVALKVLKNRYCGMTGYAGFLFYDNEHSRLVECSEENDGDMFEECADSEKDF